MKKARGMQKKVYFVENGRNYCFRWRGVEVGENMDKRERNGVRTGERLYWRVKSFFVGIISAD